jgi:hypothetical protein
VIARGGSHSASGRHEPARRAPLPRPESARTTRPSRPGRARHRVEREGERH